jgi:hypothetical protein
LPASGIICRKEIKKDGWFDITISEILKPSEVVIYFNGHRIFTSNDDDYIIYNFYKTKPKDLKSIHIANPSRTGTYRKTKKTQTKTN